MSDAVHGLTAENLLASLPQILQDDESMYALASGIANVLASRTDEIQKLAIYPRISELPADLLDILAYDFKVDWYGYNYPVAAKRNLLKSSFLVHRRLGTKGAFSAALSGIYPGATAQEWFEYGGDPYYFRIVLDVTAQQVSLSLAEITKAIEIYKSLRSRLEDDAVVFRSRCVIGIRVQTGYAVYGVRICGTFPSQATYGERASEIIGVSGPGIISVVSPPMTGALVTGTYPTIATQGAVSLDAVRVVATDQPMVYEAPKTGDVVAGTHPERATQGAIEDSALVADAEGGGAVYSQRMCGTAFGSL